MCSFSIFPVYTKQALRAPLRLWASLEPSRTQVAARPPPPLHPTYPPGDSVSTWTSVQGWQLQMLLTAVKLRGSSSHSKVQMFLFSFPCFVLFFFFFFSDLKKQRYSFGNDRNHICVALFSQSPEKPVLCVWILVSSKKEDLMLWGIPAYFDSRAGEAKSLTTDTQTPTHTRTLSG